MISNGPQEVTDRVVRDQWEGDHFTGLERSANGTLMENSRLTMLGYLAHKDGYDYKDTPKNGAPLSGYGAFTVKNAVINDMSKLPEQIHTSLTWDRGKEPTEHARFTIDTEIPVSFAVPRSPSQPRPNENTNGLLRQYFSQGNDFAGWSADALEIVPHSLKIRSRKILGSKTQTEFSTNNYPFPNKSLLQRAIKYR